MKMLNFIIVLFLIIYSTQIASQEISTGRYKIKENSKYGFIDGYGNTVIEPEYYEIGDFSEGLVAVRKGDRYHYINVNGEKIIEPLFEYAEEFKNGIAKVYISGKPFLIDYEGNILFQHSFKDISNFEGGASIVETEEGKVGLVNYNGKFVLEPIHEKIECVSEAGRFVVKGNRNKYTFLVSNQGEVIVPMEKYEEIRKFNNGYAIVRRKKVKVELEDKWFWYEPYGVIDYHGNEIFVLNESKFSPESDIFNNVFIGKLKGSYFYIDSAGNPYFKEKNCDEVTPFIEGRAFISFGREYQWRLINRDFEIVNNIGYDDIVKPGFKEGIAAVTIEGEVYYYPEWAIINRNGKLIQKFKENVSEVIELLTKNIFIVDYSRKCNGQYMLVNDKSELVSTQCFDSAQVINREEGIIEIKTGHLKKYINFEGKVIWEEKEDNSFKKLNIDFKITNPCVPNRKKIFVNREELQIEKGKIVILKDDIDTLIYGREKLLAQVVSIQNISTDTLNFIWANGKPQLMLQAKDIDDKWKDITRVQWSSCGLGSDCVSLLPFEGWNISYPLFEGNVETMLRFKLVIKRKDRGEYNVFSEEFEGNVNGGQFWREVYTGNDFRFYKE